MHLPHQNVEETSVLIDCSMICPEHEEVCQVNRELHPTHDVIQVRTDQFFEKY